MLNSWQIHEIYVDYMDVHLSIKYLHGSHVDIFHVDKIYVGSIGIEYPKIHMDSMLDLIYMTTTWISQAVFVG